MTIFCYSNPNICEILLILGHPKVKSKYEFQHFNVNFKIKWLITYTLILKIKRSFFALTLNLKLCIF